MDEDLVHSIRHRLPTVEGRIEFCCLDSEAPELVNIDPSIAVHRGCEVSGQSPIDFTRLSAESSIGKNRHDVFPSFVWSLLCLTV